MAPKLQRQNATTVAAIFENQQPKPKSEDMRSEIFAPKRPFAVGALLRVKDTTKYHSLLQQINVTYADEIDHSIWHVILTSKPYRFFIATCIIVNTFLLGYSIDLRPGLEKEIVDTTNNIINVVFVVELLARFAAEGMYMFLSGATVFDLVLCLLGTLDVRLRNLGEGENLRGIRMVVTLRIYRVKDFFAPKSSATSKDKSFVAQFFNEINLYLTVLAGSLQAGAAVLFCLGLFGWIISNIMTDVLGSEKHLSGTNGWFGTRAYWGYSTNSRVTMFTIFTLDGWSDLARVYGRYDDQYWWYREVGNGRHDWLKPVLSAVVIVAHYQILTVLMGAIVQGTVHHRSVDTFHQMMKSDNEEKMKERCSDKLFQELAPRLLENRKISIEELDNLLEKKNLTNVLEVFDLTNMDIHNVVTQLYNLKIQDEVLRLSKLQEYCQKIVQRRGPATSNDVFVTASLLRYCVKRVETIADRFQMLTQALEDLDRRVSPIANHYDGTLNQRVRLEERAIQEGRHNAKRERWHKRLSRFKPPQATSRGFEFRRQTRTGDSPRRALSPNRNRNRTVGDSPRRAGARTGVGTVFDLKDLPLQEVLSDDNFSYTESFQATREKFFRDEDKTSPKNRK